ncbi:MAG: primosomal protein N' [Burkholderiaceae bacterium]|nr:primosomal protein N' [Burkholderiaceae bacterium]
MAVLISVLVQTPAHSGLGGALHYEHTRELPVGTLVRVPLGQRETLGVVVATQDTDSLPEGTHLRPITGVLEGLAPLNARWVELIEFAARYYQRSPGEVALSSLPPALRELDSTQLARRLQRTKTPSVVQPEAPKAQTTAVRPELTDEQAQAFEQIQSEPGPFLLFGSTGSGKTEVYLRCVEDLLEQDDSAQALLMVPEINLTPQLEARVHERLAPRWGSQAIVSMHSGLTPAQRLRSWLSAHSGQARIILGTRMAILASLPHLKLIVVDEEHDPSYKQQEGARYSARDLAVYRGRLEQARVILGSATPSLESWQHSEPATSGEKLPRYQRVAMPSRIGLGALPQVRRVDMNLQPRQTVFSGVLLDAMRERVRAGEQVLVLLNRRGYSPVLHCRSCGWKSECAHCSAFRVFHKIDRTLRCHHCGLTDRVPRHCPGCGDADLGMLGRGTEMLEEQLAELLSGLTRPDGQAVRIARIDADSTRLQGALEQQLAQVHAGDVDILVGTQMIAKGHDFRRVGMVAALDPDGALFSSDFRAPERLFALLMQAGGRAGRDAALNRQSPSELWVQTFHPQHPLFEALREHDYPAFAQQQLKEREQAGMPPFSAQALVRAEARQQEAAQAFLNAAREAGEALLSDMPGHADLGPGEGLTLFAAVPMSLQRVANVERAQMLIESPSRLLLQRFLTQWHPILHSLRSQHRSVIRWAVDVDPQSI